MRIERALIDEIVEHARAEAPNECCGIVAAEDGRGVKVYRTRNAAASPVRYEIDAQDLLRAWTDIEQRGWTLEAIYHSHTRSPAYPSQTDVNLSGNWPDAICMIVSLESPQRPDVRAFRIAAGRIEEVELAIA